MARQNHDKHVDSGAGWAEIRPAQTATSLARPRAILAAVETTRTNTRSADIPWNIDDSLAELSRLAETGDIDTIRTITQRLPVVNPKTYFGEGKVQELKTWMEADECDIALFDDELSPTQQRNLEAILGPGKVVDRTQVILDIFAARAHTSEGALQVELARARYQLPRLRRLWTHLERQRGGTFTRGGAGETQLETDRRVLQRAVKRLEEELQVVRSRRADQRRQRRESLPAVALVGYTNAGKSTLLNKLTGATVTARDQLFETLDPTTRRWTLGDGHVALLTDTVGFIHKLPATVVAAFRATLEESIEADLLLHVIDASSPLAPGQAAVVLDELESIGAKATVITVLNKCDAFSSEATAQQLEALRGTFSDCVMVSAVTGEGCDLLAERVSAALAGFRLAHPQSARSS